MLLFITAYGKEDGEPKKEETKKRMMRIKKAKEHKKRKTDRQRDRQRDRQTERKKDRQ